MKLLFRQRAFSWFDSYDIYDENENTVYYPSPPGAARFTFCRVRLS